jgi:hypothetical protein
MSHCGPVVPQKRPDPIYNNDIARVGATELPFGLDRRYSLAPFPLGEGMPQVCNPQCSVRGRKAHRNLVSHAAFAAALAVALLYGNTAARAGDDDGPSVIGQIMHTLGFRSINDSYEGIDYNERSPLVVPPTRDLPSPETVNAAPAPNWPKDPDIARRQAAKKDSNKARYQKDYVEQSSRVLSRDELDRPGGPGPNAAGDGDSTANSGMVDPHDKGAKKGLFSGISNIFGKKEEYATFTGEPTRDSLTDPPPGYLTPSPDEPYGIGPNKGKYDVPTIANHGELTR